MVGRPLVTKNPPVKVTDPADVVTVTLRAPIVAVPAITKVADCKVAVPAPMIEAVTPVPLMLIEVIFNRFVPASCTVRV
jgi:hypothetical protein